MTYKIESVDDIDKHLLSSVKKSLRLLNNDLKAVLSDEKHQLAMIRGMQEKRQFQECNIILLFNH